MAKDIKVTFKKNEEDIYEYILLKGKGLYIKELVRKEMNNQDNSLDQASGSLCVIDASTKKMLSEILNNINDIKNKFNNVIKDENLEDDDNFNNTDISKKLKDNDKYRIMSHFSIDDLS